MIPDYLPPKVGREIVYAQFSEEQLATLKNKIKAKTIIAIDGLVGVGKSALGQNLSEKLGIPHLNSGFIYRILTHIYEDLKLAISPENTALVLSSFRATLENGRIQLEYQGQTMDYATLRNTHIDSVINKYNKIVDIRRQIDEFYSQFLINQVGPKTAFVLDLHGANPTYLSIPESQGYKVIRLLLVAEAKEKVRRRYEEYLRVNFSDADLSQQEKQDLYDKCERMVNERDSNDLQSIQSTGIGLIHPKSGIIDTTQLTIAQVSQTALNFILSELIVSE
jgi:cytidylate kinase